MTVRIVEDDLRALSRMLADSDHRVRLNALHALTCHCCEQTSCCPPRSDVLSSTIAILRYDAHKHVRATAMEVVGHWAHTDRAAAAALVECRESDPEPSVRKKAKGYAPGGSIYRRRARQRAA